MVNQTGNVEIELTHGTRPCKLPGGAEREHKLNNKFIQDKNTNATDKGENKVKKSDVIGNRPIESSPYMKVYENEGERQREYT